MAETARTPSGRLVKKAVLGFSILAAAIVWLLGPGTNARSQTKTKPSFWTGQLEVSVLRCNGECGYFELDEKGISRHGTKDLVSRYTYRVYQNNREIVRHALMYASGGGPNEEGRVGEIVNYSLRYSLVFYPGGSLADRVPLIFPETTSTPLESRQILGFKCTGVRRKWVQQRNRFRNVRETWTATDIDFKDPLFEVFYGYDASGIVLAEVRGMRSIKPSPPLEPSLFELPAGMEVLDVGNP